MKTLKTIALSILVSIATTISAQTKKVDTKTSSITWVGKKVTGQHSGTLSVKDGSLIFKKSKLVGGTVNVDMSSVTVTDIKAGEGKEDLEGHLKADDFFGTAKFPSAKIVFKKIADKTKGVFTVTADLTIKGITNPITFDLLTTTNSASSSLKIDRTKYGIKYNSGNFFQNLGDKVISDEFELNVLLKF